MTSPSLTIDELAESIYEELISHIVRQTTLNNISRFRTLQRIVDGEYEDPVMFKSVNPSKDIYGNDRTKTKNSDVSRYFDCGNCGRSIAAGRFAQHIGKCLERGRR